ncbi:acetolactate synthase large subunit, partial [Amycolatopsis sp. RM579]|nr:acetolactate synthase large subunit [Amycolatopsis pithecellobii]
MTSATSRSESKAGSTPTPASLGRPKPTPPVGTPVRVTGAQSLVRSLEAVGAEVVFGIPGGTILPAY